METAVGFVGGGMAVAGAVTVLKRVRNTRGSLGFGIGLIVGGLVLIVLAVVLVASNPLERSKRPAATPSAPAVKPPAVDPWANPDVAAIREQVRGAYAEYEAVVDRARRELRPELLDRVATGEQLAFLRQQIEHNKAIGAPTLDENDAQIWAITPTPQLRNVSVQVKGTFRVWDLDPKTSQKVGQPVVKVGESNPVFVWSDGRWKVSSAVFFEAP